MDITFNCDKCGQSLTIDEAGAGLSVQCPSCGKEIAIPSKPVWLSVINEVVQKEVQSILEGRNNVPEARLAIQKVLRETGYQPQPGEQDTPADFRSFERQNLVIQSNMDAARGYCQAVAANDPDLVDEFPAFELVRGGNRKHPRGDPWYSEGTDGSIGWGERWLDAADEADDDDAARIFHATGRMIALKSSDIWKALGDGVGGREDTLGFPYEPFALDSGMVRYEIGRSEAEALGLLDTNEKAEPADLPCFKDGFEQDTGSVTDFLHNTLLALQHRFIPIEDERVTKWLWNQPEKCCHCGEARPRKVLCECDDCGETICSECKAKGCSGPEPPPEPQDAMQCFADAVSQMQGREFPLEKDVAERVVQLCNRAFEFGFAPHRSDFEARTHRMRGEALESLGSKDRAVQEYELAVEKDPQVGVKKRLASLRKECGRD